MKNESKLKTIIVELGQHMPYSIIGVTAGIVAMGVLSFFAILLGAEHRLALASRELFHVFHPAHVLFSAVATTAMFWKHDQRSMIKAVLIGLIGSISICGISDIFFPFVGGQILGVDMHMHICLLEEPQLVYPFAVIGVMAGLMVTKTFEKSSEYSHSMHVFLSSMASILYLLSFGLTNWTASVASVFMITIVAVMIPCCASDIAFPLACTHKYCKHD